MCIETYWFLPVISSVVITFTCPFTTDDDHLQKWTILSSVICRYTSHQPIWHQPEFDQFCPKILLWNYMDVLCYKASNHRTFYIIWIAVLHRFAKCYSIHNKDRSWYLTNDPFHMVEIIGIRNDAFHDSIPGHQLKLLWRNAVSDLYINEFFFLVLKDGAFHTPIKYGSIWDLKLCQMRGLPFSCISQFVIMEII